MKTIKDIFNKQSKIFVICQPGFEEELLKEIQEVWPLLIGLDGRAHTEPIPEFKVLKGGIALTTDYVLALQLNYFLKLASRILIRLAEFRCKDLPKLYQRTMALPWNQILKSPHFELHVTARKSRLNNENRISESVQAAILQAKFPSTKKSESTQAPLIFVRNESDTVSISIDTSGELLYKRGWFEWKEEAPLRESAANFMLRKLVDTLNRDETQKITLIDPMCGSGTLLLESLSFRYPNFKRHFGFLDLNICPKIFSSPSLAFNYKIEKQPLFLKMMGKDIDSKAISSCRENLKNFALINKIDQQPEVLFETQDLFSDKVLEGDNWVICNPPYGVRLAQEKTLDKKRFPSVWLAQVEKIYRPSRVAFVYPKSLLDDGRFASQLGFSKVLRFPFRNGGIEVNLWVLSR